MDAIFVESGIFEKYRMDYLLDDQFRLLQIDLLNNPYKGDVISGTGGLRKIRFAAKGKGKRGGIRVIYYYFDKSNKFYLLTLYAKNEMTDLTSKEKHQLKHLMELWLNEQT